MTKIQRTPGQRLGTAGAVAKAAIDHLVKRWGELYPIVKSRPLNPVMICDACRCMSMADGLDHVRTLRGRHGGHPDQDSPDEHETLCRGCHRRDTYRHATPDEIESEYNAERSDLHEGGA